MKKLTKPDIEWGTLILEWDATRAPEGSWLWDGDWGYWEVREVNWEWEATMFFHGLYYRATKPTAAEAMQAAHHQALNLVVHRHQIARAHLEEARGDRPGCLELVQD